MRTPSLGRSLTIGLIGVSALVAAIAMGCDAAGNAWARSNPALALRLAPGNPAALARAADLKLAKSEPILDVEAIRQALRAAPLSAALIRSLALSSADSSEKTRRLMTLAERSTRRDIPTQFWKIEDAVERGDIPEALHHYDIALATSRDAQAVLFPILIRSLSDPDIRANLKGYLRQDRVWVKAFLTQAIAEGAPADVGQLIADLEPSRRSKEILAARAGLVGALTVRKDYVGLRQYTATLWPAAQSAIRQFAINSQTTNPSLRPLTWELTDDGDVRAQAVDDGDLVISASNGARGIAARRIVLLSPGNWKLSHAVKTASDVPVPDVAWDIQCLTGNGESSVWRQSLARGQSRFEREMTIPADCQATEFRIVAGANFDEAANSTITMSGLSLQRLP